jgi:superfamily II DNA or RNA helicase
MAPVLRPQQVALMAELDAAIAEGHTAILVQAPTGFGKSVLMAAAAARAIEAGQHALCLAHRRELVQQLHRKLFDAGLDAGVIAAGFPSRPSERAQVASVQTFSARIIRSSLLELPPADLLLIDEAHHAIAPTWAKISERYPDAIQIGWSATPCRSDGRGLGSRFTKMVCGPSYAELINAGHLVPTKVYAPSRPDLSGVRISHGDYNEAQLAERMDQPKLVGDIIEHWHRLAEGRRTVVFATSVAHAVHLCGEFGRAGVAAAYIDGSTPTPERDATLAKLAAGSLDVVCNCGVLTEGWDQPEVACIVMARPTKSLVLYRQIIGRGLRPAPGKDHCLILDHAGATFEHGLIEEPTAWTLAPDQRAQRQRKADRDTGRAPRLTECPECTAVRWEGRPCSACGWRPRPKPAPVEVADGELGHVDRDRTVWLQTPTASDRARFHAELAWIANERGYASGWIAHKFKEKFGAWPLSRFAPPPLEPRPETRSWMRSRMIAYAKGRAKAGAA